MKKKAIAMFCFAGQISMYAQIGIKTDSPTAALDINGNARIRNVSAGVSTNELLVIDSNGNVKKIPPITSTGGGNSGNGFNSSILGYEPQPMANRVVPATAQGGALVTELGCKQWAGTGGNNHWYCGYNLSAGISWFNAFLFAKQLGGYLITMPNDAERIWVANNILSGGTGLNMMGHIWIGYNKIATPGNPSTFRWITGEEFKINWATNPAVAEHYFNPGEPNNYGGYEGSSHILAGASADRRWNDGNGNDASAGQIIVEFNE